MVTYFLKGKGETPVPTPSPITATITDIPIHLTNGSAIVSPSDPTGDHSDLVPLSGSFGDQTTEEMDDDDNNIDYSKLTQKRKSLCRQPNISHPPPTSACESSLSQSSDASDSQASQALLDRTNAANMANTIAQTTNIMESIILGTSNISHTFDALPKSQLNELKHHSMPPLSNKSHLMDSIESLEKFLKNDLSLAEFNSRNTIKAQVFAQSQLPLRPAKQPRIHRINELLSKSNDALNKGIGTTLKESIKVNRRTVMKLSQSWYPIAHHRVVSKCKIPTSKSCDLLL